MNRFVKIHGPTIFWAVLIFVLSSFSSVEHPKIGFAVQDKVAHIMVFGVFGFLLQRSFYHVWGNGFRIYLLVFIVGVGYGGLDEIHQLFVEGRESSIGDFIADSAGIVLFQAVFWITSQFDLII